jgi:hypothetical protein
MKFCRRSFLASLGPVFVLCFLQNAAFAKNLIKNGSFEAGIDYKFSVSRWYVDGLPSLTLDSSESVDGRYSLRAPFSRLGYTAKPHRFDGIALRSAVPISVAPGTSYSFSVYIKSDKPKRGRLVLTTNNVGEYNSPAVATREILIGTKWKKTGITFSSGNQNNVYWEIQVDSRTPGNVWLDALQLEPGTYSDYEPAAALEATLSSDIPGKIFTSGENPTVILRARNYSGTAIKWQSFELRVYEIGGSLVHKEKIISDLPAKGGIDKKVTLPIDRNGVYRCVLHMDNKLDTESQLHFSILPPLRKVPASQSAFGSYLTVAPEPLAIMQRVGFKWIANLTSNGQIVYWKQVEPSAGHYIWYDDEIMLARSYGYEFMFNLEPCMLPKWAASLSRAKMIDAWSEYVQEMVKHYGRWVKYWTIGDEVHHGPEQNSWMSPCWASASEYAAWHRVGYQAIKKVDPGAKVILNALDDFASETFKYLSPQQVDVLAVNAYHSPILLKQMKQTAERHDVTTLWAPGIAVDSFSFYREHVPGKSLSEAVNDYWRNKNRELVKSVIQTLALGYERLFHYTATYVGNSNHFSLFEADSGLKPIGVQFGALIWLLDGLETAHEITLDRFEQTIRLFRFDRRDHMTVFAFWALGTDRQSVQFTKFSGSDAILYDHFANVLPIGFENGKASIKLGKEPVFLVVPSHLAMQTERALKTISLRIDELPSGAEHVVVGRYAKIVGTIDDIPRQKPNISLWYQSDTKGWTEILRFRSSNFVPEYKVTNDGFEITWNIIRPTSAFYLEPGMLPGELAHDAVLYSSRQEKGIESWTREQLNLSVESYSMNAAQPAYRPEGVAMSNFPVHIFNTANGLQVRFITILEGGKEIFDNQDLVFGGWQVFTRASGECFLHNYFKPGKTGRIKIRVHLSVSENNVTPAH